MEGLYYLTYIIAVLVVIQWYRFNEMKGGETTGLLAMREGETAEQRRGRRKDRKGPRFKAFGEE